MTQAELKEAYIQELITNPEYNFSSEVAESTVEKMIDAIIRTSYPADWYAHNKALKIVGKRFGLKTSKEPRETLKSI